MTHRNGQKHGVFASLSDADGRMMTWGTLGIEGMLPFFYTTTLEGRAGLGVSDVHSLDYIFGDVSITYAAFSDIEIETVLTLTNFDQAAFRALSYDASIIARYSHDGARLGGAFAQVAQNGLRGRDGAPGETRFGLGLTLSLGQSVGVVPEARPFRRVDPVAPLVRRGLW